MERYRHERRMALVTFFAAAVAWLQPLHAETRAPIDAAAGTELAKFDPDSFERLTPEQRVATVVRAARWRDHQLQNFAYELTADGENVAFRQDLPADPTRVLKHQTEFYGLRRKGDQYLFYGRFLGRDFCSHWDGFVYRTFTIDHRTGEKNAVIRRGEQRGVYHVQFNHLLGFRTVGILSMKGAEVYAEPATLPECLEHLVRERFPTRAEVVRDADKTLVKLQSLTYAMKPRCFWFDPGRDWMPVTYGSRDLDRDPLAKVPPDDWAGDDSLPAGNLNLAEVVEAARVDGLWVPVKMKLRYRMSTVDRGNIQTLRTYDVKSFKRNGVKDADLRVAFPPGTSVVDDVANVAYAVKPDGKPEPRALFDRRSRQVRTADAAELARALEVNPVGDVTDPSDPARQAALRALDGIRSPSDAGPPH